MRHTLQEAGNDPIKGSRGRHIDQMPAALNHASMGVRDAGGQPVGRGIQPGGFSIAGQNQSGRFDF